MIKVGGTGRTRTVIISLDKRVPHLSATVPCGSFLTGMAGLEPAKPRGHLIEGQAAFPFAYIPTFKDRYRRRESNPHPLVSKTSASAKLGYAGVKLKRRLREEDSNPHLLFQRQASGLWTIPDRMNPARLERAASSFGGLRSNPSELRVRVEERRRCDSNAQGPGFGPAA